MNEFEVRIGLGFPLEHLSKEICEVYNLGQFVSNKLIEIGYEDYNFILQTSKGKYVVKVFSNERSDTDAQNLVDRALVAYQNGCSCPKIFTAKGRALTKIKLHDVTFRLCVMEYIDGQNFFVLGCLPTTQELKIIASQIAKLNRIDYQPDFIYDKWAIINFENEFNKNKHLLQGEEFEKISGVYEEFKNIDTKKLKYGFVHGDIIETNIIKDKEGKLWFIDFSVSNYLPRIVDLAVTICDLCLDLNNYEKSKLRAREFLDEYQKKGKLSSYEAEALKTFLKTHQAITIIETLREKNDGNMTEENEIFLNKGRVGLNMILKESLI